MFRTYDKIKGRSFAEIKERSRQGINILAERIGVSSQVALQKDQTIIQQFLAANSGGEAEDLLRYLRSRDRGSFYPSCEDLKGTVDEFRRSFPMGGQEIIARADRIRNGYFDLLGYENLYFGGEIPNWHFDPVSNKECPRIHWSKIEEVSAERSGDKKVIWELNRHQYFTILGRAYWLTNDEKYAETWAAHVENWIANNEPKLGVNWLSSLEIAFRSISWIWGLNFFENSPHLTPELLGKILKCLASNGRHIETYLSTYFSPNTHLTGEALGLYALGTFLPEFKAAQRWREVGYEILMSALEFQVLPDGVYCEQSSHYHRYTVDFYLSLLILLKQNGSPVENRHEDKLNQLLTFLLHAMGPNGETPLFGDDDGGRLHSFDERSISDFRSTLALGSVLLRRGDLKFAAKDHTAELIWLLGPTGAAEFDRLNAAAPGAKALAFVDGGIFLARSSWERDADLVLIDCGPHGFLNGGHAHSDALNFVYISGGEPLFVDSGTFCYTSDLAARNYFRSSAAHNCLSVDGESSSVPAGAFSWKSTDESELLHWEHDGNRVEFRGSHNGFARLGVQHEREIVFGHKRLTVRDVIRSNQPRLFELSFILAPAVHADIQNNSPRLSAPHKVGTHLLHSELEGADAHLCGTWKVQDCFISPCYGKLTATTKLVYEVRAEGEFSILNIVESVRE